MIDFELLSCPKCQYHGKPRPATGRWIMPCPECGSIDLELSDLIPTNTRPVQSRMRGRTGGERPFEPHGGAPHASPGRGDPGGSLRRPGDRAHPPAPAPARSLNPDLDGEVSIGPLLEQ